MLTVIALSLLSGRDSLSQTVHGKIVGESDGEPVGGAFLFLVDDNGERVAAALTDEVGRFSLAARESGRYRIRMESIGYREETSSMFELKPDQSYELNLHARLEPVQLAMIEVTVEDGRCRTRDSESEVVAMVWEEARKALTATAWTPTIRPFRYEMVEYEKSMEPNGRVREEAYRSREGTGRTSPFFSSDASVLAEHGYVRFQPDTLIYYAPDADALLSEAFAETHCFHLVRDEEGEESQIGLAFAPEKGRRVPDIAGVIWVNEQTSELDRVEFRYTDLPRSDLSENARGFVKFTRLPSGAWIVREWWIRMPMGSIEYRQEYRHEGGLIVPTGPRVPVARYTRLKEAGGEVVNVVTPDGQRLFQAEPAIVTGFVRDPTRSGAPVPGAIVYLDGSPADTTDESGRYRLASRMPGRHTVTFSHPRLDTLGYRPDELEVELRREEVSSLDLFVPTEERLFAALCPDRVDAPEIIGLVHGVARSEPGDLPLPGARVVLSWSTYAVAHRAPAGVRAREGRFELVTRTRADGTYTACGVHPDVAVEAVVEFAGGADTLAFRTPPDRRITRQDLVLPELDLEPMAIVTRRKADGAERPVHGRVVDGMTGEPLAGTQVHFPELETGTVAGEDGRFRLPVAPDGDHRLVVQHLGYTELEVPLAIRRGEAIELEVHLIPAAIAVDPLVATFPSAAERADRSRGHAVYRMTSETIAQNPALSVAYLLERFVPGIDVATARGPLGCPLIFFRGPTSYLKGFRGYPPPLIEIDGFRTTDTCMLDLLNPADIDTIEVLGVAGAAQLYAGSEAAAGMIRIRTKSRPDRNR